MKNEIQKQIWIDKIFYQLFYDHPFLSIEMEIEKKIDHKKQNTKTNQIDENFYQLFYDDHFLSIKMKMKIENDLRKENKIDFNRS